MLSQPKIRDGGVDHSVEPIKLREVCLLGDLDPISLLVYHSVWGPLRLESDFWALEQRQEQDQLVIGDR